MVTLHFAAGRFLKAVQVSLIMLDWVGGADLI